MKKLVTLIMTLVMVASMMLMPTYAVTFSDLDAGHWAYEYITTLTDSGVINGYTDGTFRPSGTITRGEFVKLVMSSCIPSYWDLEEVGASFEHWAASYVMIAEMQGVLEAGEFNVDNIDQPITRIEMMRLISKADTIMKESPYELTKAYSFTDVGTISVDDALLLQHAYGKGYIAGYEDGTFKPEKTMTRAEAATMIYRFTR